MASKIATLLTEAMPTLAVSVGILINNSRLAGLERHMDERFSMMEKLFDEKLRRVECVIDARLTRISQCAPTAQIASGGRSHPCSCRRTW